MRPRSRRSTRVGIPRIEDHNEPGAVGAGPMPMSSRDGVRVTSADAYLADGARPPNLVIRTDAMVAAVVIEVGPRDRRSSSTMAR